MKLKQTYPWIPLLGIPLTLISDVDETNLRDPVVHFVTAFIQGISLVAILLWLLI